MAKNKVTVQKTVDYDRLKCLLVASYLLGQESGLRGLKYDNPIALKQRENIINLMFNGEV